MDQFKRVRTLKRPLREWMSDNTQDQGFQPSASAGGTETEVKVPGFVVAGMWRDVNEFMTELDHYVAIIAQKHGIKIMR